MRFKLRYFKFPTALSIVFAGNLRDSEHQTGPQKSNSNKPKCSTERVSYTPLLLISWKTLISSPFWECCGEQRCFGVWDVGTPSYGAGGARRSPAEPGVPPEQAAFPSPLFIQTELWLPPPSLFPSQLHGSLGVALLELLENFSQQQPRTRQSSEVKKNNNKKCALGGGTSALTSWRGWGRK